MLKTIDLFAGAGGLSYGFESTNQFLIVAAVENNKNARMTYIENHKGREDIIMIPDVRGCNFMELSKKVGGIDNEDRLSKYISSILSCQHQK